MNWTLLLLFLFHDFNLTSNLISVKTGLHLHSSLYPLLIMYYFLVCKLPSIWMTNLFLETWYESLASGITNCKVTVPEEVREPIKIYMTYIFFEITPLRIDRPNFALSKWVIIQEITENFNCHHFLYNSCNVHAALYNFKFDRASSSTWGSRGLVPDQLKKTVGFQSPPRSEKRGMAKKKSLFTGESSFRKCCC